MACINSLASSSFRTTRCAISLWPCGSIVVTIANTADNMARQQFAHTCVLATPSTCFLRFTNFLHLSIISDCRVVFDFHVRFQFRHTISQSNQITNKTFNAANRIYKLQKKKRIENIIKMLKVIKWSGEFKLNRAASPNFMRYQKKKKRKRCVLLNFEGGHRSGSAVAAVN